MNEALSRFDESNDVSSLSGVFNVPESIKRARINHQRITES